jgi:hypothetical protein
MTSAFIYSVYPVLKFALKKDISALFLFTP